MLLKQPLDYFEEVYRIYEESFPEVERRTKAGQKAVMGNPRYRLRAVLENEGNGPVRAFLGYWELDSCIFLEHLASAPLCRGKGYGHMLVQECIREGQEKGKPLFLEIEPVTEADPMTGRREKFYHRCGFVTNRFPYEQMPLKEGDHPVPLWIMSRPEAIGEDEFFPFKREIYRQVYHVER